jgi:hypothetical protein
MHLNHTEPTVMATRARMSDATALAGTATPNPERPVRSRLASSWLFTRHLLEMVVAMLAGMAMLEGRDLGAGRASRLLESARRVRPDGGVDVRIDGGVDALPRPSMV